MTSSLSKIPAGVQYIFDGEVRLRRFIEREIMAVFEGWSYAEIILPIFDYADLFALGMGKEQAEKTYRFTGRDGKLLALRPDLTSLVARTIATRFRDAARPIRLCYSGEVFRWDEPRGGRQYEFHQIGLEHIGSNRLEADTEALVMVIEALNRLGLEGFTITLSHVDFFKGIAENLALDEANRKSLREMIDRKEVEHLDRFLAPYAEPSVREIFCKLVTLAGKGTIIDEARACVTNEQSVAALDDLERVYKIAEALNIDSRIDIDLGDVGELDYYTGLTFKIYAQGLGTELGRGGRYDNLLANFGSSEPAVGFSLCLDWLAQLLGRKLRDQLDSQTEEVAGIEAGRDIIAAFKEANLFREKGRKILIRNSEDKNKQSE
ncbi:MAG: ATP phosphoribosyltransferase regulatory subunit [Acidobacteriota bacterium]